MSFIAASAAWDVSAHADFASYAGKFAQWCERARAGGASLAVFPEYGTMELACLLAPAVASDLHASIAALQAWLEPLRALWREQAVRHGLHILAPSFPERQNDGRYCNVARLFGPKGGEGAQHKLIMTRFEREQWHISAGSGIQVFETELGRVGIAICYDGEFPLIARAMAEAGATTLLVPSCTDTLHGYHRVAVGARARALENQFHVIQSPLVGLAPWSPAIDENHGAAAIYGPPDIGFPADGIIASGGIDQPGLVFGEIDTEKVAAVRKDGRVLNHQHWGEQGAMPLAPARIVRVA